MSVAGGPGLAGQEPLVMAALQLYYDHLALGSCL